MTNQHSTTLRLTRNDGWVATYHGGAYIEISHETAVDDAIDVINVWDYEHDVPTIPFTDDAISDRLAEWVAECGRDYAINVLAHRH